MKRRYKTQKEYIYLLKPKELPSGETPFIKYGYSKYYPIERLKHWERRLRLDLRIAFVAYCKNPSKVEDDLKVYTWFHHTAVPYEASKIYGSIEITLSKLEDLMAEVKKHTLFIKIVNND